MTNHMEAAATTVDVATIPPAVVEATTAIATPVEAIHGIGGMFHQINLKIVFATLIGCGVLGLIHFFAPKIRKYDDFDTGIFNSIGGGIILAYIFLEAFPSLMLDVPQIQALTTSGFLGTPKNMLFTVFLFVLGGFFISYILEKLAHDYSQNGREGNTYIYYSHLALSTVLTFCVAGTMCLVSLGGLTELAMFTAVMGFYFFLEDHSLSHHFPTRFNHVGRYVLIGATACGFLYGNLVLKGTVTLSLIFAYAFLLGVMILATTKTEFSALEGRSHFGAFITSLFVKATIVFVTILLQSIK